MMLVVEESETAVEYAKSVYLGRDYHGCFLQFCEEKNICESETIPVRHSRVTLLVERF